MLFFFFFFLKTKILLFKPFTLVFHDGNFVLHPFQHYLSHIETRGPWATIRSPDKKQLHVLHICKCHATSSSIATATRAQI